MGNDFEKSGERLQKDKIEAMRLFQDWERWDQDRTLDYFIQNFMIAEPARRATIAEILCAVLFESCSATRKSDHERIKKIVPLIKRKELNYIPESYLKAYHHEQKTAAGENFLKMLKMGQDVFE